MGAVIGVHSGARPSITRTQTFAVAADDLAYLRPPTARHRGAADNLSFGAAPMLSPAFPAPSGRSIEGYRTVGPDPGVKVFGDPATFRAARPVRCRVARTTKRSASRERPRRSPGSITRRTGSTASLSRDPAGGDRQEEHAAVVGSTRRPRPRCHPSHRPRFVPGTRVFETGQSAIKGQSAGQLPLLQPGCRADFTGITATSAPATDDAAKPAQGLTPFMSGYTAPTRIPDYDSDGGEPPGSGSGEGCGPSCRFDSANHWDQHAAGLG